MSTSAVHRFDCPYLKAEVELTDERERHISERHPELLPELRTLLAQTLADPDHVRRSLRFAHARLFSRWYTELQSGKHVVVVVVSQPEEGRRHWVITAYLTGRLAAGELEWSRR